jgi:hypothetical protein
MPRPVQLVLMLNHVADFLELTLESSALPEVG